MTLRLWALLLTLGAAVASGSEGDNGTKKAAEPFYRKYLVPGNRLDDRILEQEQRVNAAPNDASLRNDFGNLLAARRFPREAAEQYELAAKLDKTNFISLYNLGLLRETEGKVEHAIHAYKRSIDRKHGFPAAHFRLGRLYEHTARDDEAVAEYSTAFQIDPAMRDPHHNPLVVDSRLIYAASLTNYARDVASASMSKESVYVEESRFRAVPVDRAVSSQEAAGEDLETVPEPRQIGTADAAGSAGSEAGPASGGARRPGARPTAQEPAVAPMSGRPRPAPNTPRRNQPRAGTPAGAAPPGSAAPQPPPVEAAPPPTEPETPPESMPEPTPAAPAEDEPS